MRWRIRLNRDWDAPSYDVRMARSMDRSVFLMNCWMARDSFPSLWVVMLSSTASRGSNGSKRFCICVIVCMIFRIVRRASFPAPMMLFFTRSVLCRELRFAASTKLLVTLQTKRGRNEDDHLSVKPVPKPKMEVTYMARKAKRMITENVAKSHRFDDKAAPRPAQILPLPVDLLISKKRPKPAPHNIQTPATAYPWTPVNAADWNGWAN